LILRLIFLERVSIAEGECWAARINCSCSEIPRPLRPARERLKFPSAPNRRAASVSARYAGRISSLIRRRVKNRSAHGCARNKKRGNPYLHSSIGIPSLDELLLQPDERLPREQNSKWCNIPRRSRSKKSNPSVNDGAATVES